MTSHIKFTAEKLVGKRYSDKKALPAPSAPKILLKREAYISDLYGRSVQVDKSCVTKEAC